MTLNEACEILKDSIVGNGLEDNRISWGGESGDNAIRLDGLFTPTELEAIVVYMKATIGRQTEP